MYKRQVPVLGREDFLHLIVEIVFLADVHHAPDDLVMVDTLHRVVVDVVFLVGDVYKRQIPSGPASTGTRPSSAVRE